MSLIKPVIFIKEDIILQFSCSIINVFEDELQSRNIYLSDKFREGDESESCIFGETYFKIEDDIKNLTNIFINNVLQNGGN